MTVIALSPEQREAQLMIQFFTTAKDGEAVMDGAGTIWHRSGEFWVTGTRSRFRQVTPVQIARALCPDLAEHMTEDLACTGIPHRNRQADMPGSHIDAMRGVGK